MPSIHPFSRYKTSPDGIRDTGFTLIELMVTLGIAIVLAAIAMPQFKVAMQGQQTTAEITNLYNDLQYARSEALKEGQFVSLCVLSKTSTACDTSGSWNQGWIIYANTGYATSLSYSSSTDTILRQQTAFTSSDTIATNPVTTNIVTFNRDGFGTVLKSTGDSSLGSAGLLFTLSTSNTNTAATRCIWMTILGRMYIQNHGAAAANSSQTNLCS